MTKYMFFELGLLVFTVLLGVFCLLLSRKLRKLNNLETGLGGAIAVMTSEINRLDDAIQAAASEADQAAENLSENINLAKAERQIWELQKQALPKEKLHEQLRSLRRTRRRKGGSNV